MGRLPHTLGSAWRNRVSAEPHSPALTYFDQTLSAHDVDTLSDALAAELQSRSVRTGDSVGIRLQNTPQFALSLLALWKIGGVALVLNPMYQDRELEHILDDAQPVGLIVAEQDPAVGEFAGGWVITVDERDFQSRNDTRVFGDAAAGKPPATADRHSSDFLRLVTDRHTERPVEVTTRAYSPALLTYTSGTTGPAKGAVGTHHNLLAVAAGNAYWCNLQPGEKVLAVAPMFHITGAVATTVTALTNPVEYVLINRLQADVMRDAIIEHRIQHILGSITVYNALLDLPANGGDELPSLKSVYSGGAPVPPATVDRFRRRYGHYIHNIYGMTETASAVIAVPLGVEAPIHGPSGTLSIGVPLPGVDARVTDMDGRVVPVGQQGELELAGPQVSQGYLNNREATDHAIVEGWLRTGDVAIMDEEGWIYLVDRKKDQINVSGYKVWPREVEDILYEHPAVREAAVIGEPDPYSGERVAAFVSLQHQALAEPEELRQHMHGKLATYKCPKNITVIDELPKTATGKIQRRKLRHKDA
ncbi:long-chain fatty acid--CoA ligase [Nesterenkonia natronophila]|uniref:Long-chain fatty acid--CoA ligase n=1 Tax=Nesterenkonia natronophila TaxID=2174932 RepID=A0A3A4FDI6_9MICC|nr:long-chain fatty acid--CoA ligase [Nesterenkonia natronophila]